MGQLSHTTHPIGSTKDNHWKYLMIIGVLFFVFGFVTWLGSVLIPFLKITCELNNVAAYLIAFSFYISYLLLALPAAILLNKTGYKNGMVLGLLLLATGTFIFFPAAHLRIYWVFLIGQFVQGSGLAILQTAANPYVVILGPRNSAARRISMMGICNGIAGIIAPIILGSFILNDTDVFKQKLVSLNPAQRVVALNHLSATAIIPYVFMTIILVFLSGLLFYSNLPEINPDEAEEDIVAISSERKSIFHFPHLLLGVFTLFLYVGVEVISGDSIIIFGASQGIALSTAKFFTSFTLGGMLLGYIIGIIIIPKYLTQERALKYSAICGILFCLVAIFTHGYISVAFIALLGLANAMMYPSIWPLALHGLGSHTKIGSSLLIMSIGGGAILPLIYGKLADISSPHQAYWLVIPCYLVIFYYATKGHQWKAKQTNSF